MSSLHPGLEEHRRQAQAVLERVHRLTDDLNDEQARWRPLPGKWSVIECLHHLNEVDDKGVTGLRRGVDRGRTDGKTADPSDPKPYPRGFLAKLAASSMEPPYRMKMKAPKMYASPPELKISLDEVVARFDDIHERLIDTIEASDGLALGRIKVQSPVTSLLKFNVDEWYAFLMAHDRRHLWQAEQVRGMAGFPG